MTTLILSHSKGINGILADEMGLGKTVQSIALLAHLAEVRETSRAKKEFTHTLAKKALEYSIVFAVIAGDGKSSDSQLLYAPASFLESPVYQPAVLQGQECASDVLFYFYELFHCVYS